MGQQHTASEEQFIDVQISEAFHNHGVAPDSKLRAVLARDAIVETTGRTAAVRVRDEHGRVLSLDDKLAEMKQEYMYAHHFPKGKPVVPASDLVATRDAFDEIRSGRVRVE
jgi:DNA-binding transcriptional regulator YbjK